MAEYSIKNLSDLSGIMAHTLRMWEQRYNLLEPARTDSNIRIYSGNDLKKLMRVAMLYKNGYKISKIAAMNQEELSEHVMNLIELHSDIQIQIDQFMDAMLQFDEAQFDRIFSKALLQYGLVDAMIRIILPLVDKIGVLWQTGSILTPHEQFISNLIRQRLCVAIDGLPGTAQVEAKKIAIFLPEGEYREMGGLFFKYLITKCGHHPIYLGKAIPAEELVAFSKQCQVDAYFTSVTAFCTQDIVKYFNVVCQGIKDKPIYLNARTIRIRKLEFPPQIKLVEDKYCFRNIPNINPLSLDHEPENSGG
ncbi:MAG: MerR family transcriptional regulator [Bacteroidales bacterium]